MAGSGCCSSWIYWMAAPVVGDGAKLQVPSPSTGTSPCWLRAKAARSWPWWGRHDESDVVPALQELWAIWRRWQGPSQLCWEAGLIGQQLGRKSSEEN